MLSVLWLLDVVVLVEQLIDLVELAVVGCPDDVRHLSLEAVYDEDAVDEVGWLVE
jgi:hypothetical protein